MKKLNMQIKNSLLLVGILVIVGCKFSPNKEPDSRVDALPFFNEASFTPKWIAPNSTILESFHIAVIFTIISMARSWCWRTIFSRRRK